MRGQVAVEVQAHEVETCQRWLKVGKPQGLSQGALRSFAGRRRVRTPSHPPPPARPACACCPAVERIYAALVCQQSDGGGAADGSLADRLNVPDRLQLQRCVGAGGGPRRGARAARCTGAWHW